MHKWNTYIGSLSTAAAAKCSVMLYPVDSRYRYVILITPTCGLLPLLCYDWLLLNLVIFCVGVALYYCCCCCSVLQTCYYNNAEVLLLRTMGAHPYIYVYCVGPVWTARFNIDVTVYVLRKPSHACTRALFVLLPSLLSSPFCSLSVHSYRRFGVA